MSEKLIAVVSHELAKDSAYILNSKSPHYGFGKIRVNAWGIMFLIAASLLVVVIDFSGALMTTIKYMMFTSGIILCAQPMLSKLWLVLWSATISDNASNELRKKQAKKDEETFYNH